ncbi:ABC transporter substrate-binding protein [Paucibacter aquatile]|uniref:ABC transporter substrate-binding protein n=1 Tax=Kinneretia aquatilis TaxID=2070761 RepID=A0A2N8KWN0_9BURK|nr:tripartite tricarboxylate transporter substrate binding protein [Paucibacter aquatile]PND37812.1 ABC transporter substrate-binding protein [Paucibacter aquatile]
MVPAPRNCGSRRLLLALAASGLVPPLRAEPAWPAARPIKLIVPFPAGSSPDLVARWLAEPLAAAQGQTVLVENRPGAGGNVGTALAAQAAPDGYTLLLTIQGPLVTAPLLNPKLPYDPLRDLRPIGLVASSPNVLVLGSGVNARDCAEFVRQARVQGVAWNYGSVGNGSASHLAMESFKARAGLALTHVPYAGFPQVTNALLSGELQAAFMVPGLAMAQVRAGKLKALAVSSLGRVAALADLPTLVELGYPGFEAISWQALLAPARTPSVVVERLSAELLRICRSDAFRAKLLGLYFSAQGTAPEGLLNLMRADRLHWAQVIKMAQVKAD